MHELLNQKADQAKDKQAALGKNLNLDQYIDQSTDHHYLDQLSNVDKKDVTRFLDVGIDTQSEAPATFIQKDHSVIHCHSHQKGIDIMKYSQALTDIKDIDQYIWKGVAVDTDKYTARVGLNPHDGYFIRAQAGVKTEQPIQSCLYISTDRLSQNVHNLVIAEEGSDLKIVTGCSTAPHLNTGLHIGVSEFYVKKNATLSFTMIHDWGKHVDVRPRTTVFVEEGGVFVSNYICLHPAGTLQMYPTTILNGPGAVARLNSVIVSTEGSHIDMGGRVILNAPESRAEIISRAIVSGGTIIARGSLIGKAPKIRAHLECKGLILAEGLMHAIPEIEGYVPGVEMSHEAAVGKIDPEEVEYLMARGLDEETAVSTIVRGFLNIDIQGLPETLQKRIDTLIQETEKDMF
ncbi:MAG: SufD family Fe-S cluster assembly protein [Candidatus Magnetomorum sp.]|nr:SufD family Fe-S cluster assembly protein [Candidatus Magnetomorum sp.]